MIIIDNNDDNNDNIAAKLFERFVSFVIHSIHSKKKKTTWCLPFLLVFGDAIFRGHCYIIVDRYNYEKKGRIKAATTTAKKNVSV